MNIKKIVLQGFKSFADRTEIEFDKGITAFVGPNGSGKTSIMSALCFALGTEKENPENMIFSGNKSVKEASVEVIYENKISLKRIIKKNGESRYYVNNKEEPKEEYKKYIKISCKFDLISQNRLFSLLNMNSEYLFKYIEEASNFKKGKEFLNDFNKINQIFKKNARIIFKNKVFLELENKNYFGVCAIIKRKDKYFDVSSLSRGEQSLILLALIFAIQEYRKSNLIFLDEADCLLDKKHSKMLSLLLKKYSKNQNILITHNDEIIENARLLYGVSMKNGSSKIASLEISKLKNEKSEVKEFEKELLALNPNISKISKKIFKQILKMISEPSLIGLDASDLIKLFSEGDIAVYSEKIEDILKETNLSWKGVLFLCECPIELPMEDFSKNIQELTSKLNPDCNVILGAKINPKIKKTKFILIAIK